MSNDESKEDNEFQKEIFINYKKPEGENGAKIIQEMNEHHEKLASWAVSNLNVKEDDIILDIGCGGGVNIKRFSSMTNGRVYGIDYSKKSVEESIKYNKDLIDVGKVKVLEGSVSDIPFEDETFDIVSGFETTYFWPDLLNDFKEIYRVLKKDGLILIANTDSADKEFSDKMLGIIEFLNMNLLTNKNMINTLKEAGFKDIELFVKEQDDYSCFIGKKL